MCTRCAFVTGLVATVAAPRLVEARPGDPTDLELAMPGMRRVAPGVWLGRLSSRVWLHTTTHDIGGGDIYPANGGIVVGAGSALLIDTGWTGAQTATILEAWRRTGGPPITRALVTHFHYDRLGGLGSLAKRGIPGYGNPLTIGLAIDHGFVPPLPIHRLEKTPSSLGGVEAFYPGEGHTLDNIVAWVPDDRVLFGGCLVKSTTSQTLGNLGDARLAPWPETIREVRRRYAPRHVVPGHGRIAGDSLAHTLAMAEPATRA